MAVQNFKWDVHVLLPPRGGRYGDNERRRPRCDGWCDHARIRNIRHTHLNTRRSQEEGRSRARCRCGCPRSGPSRGRLEAFFLSFSTKAWFAAALLSTSNTPPSPYFQPATVASIHFAKQPSDRENTRQPVVVSPSSSTPSVRSPPSANPRRSSSMADPTSSRERERERERKSSSSSSRHSNRTIRYVCCLC